MLDTELSMMLENDFSLPLYGTIIYLLDGMQIRRAFHPFQPTGSLPLIANNKAQQNVDGKLFIFVPLFLFLSFLNLSRSRSWGVERLA